MPSNLLSQPLSTDMGPAVLGLLRALTPLPDRGIVAGQAVTSALLELFGDGARKGPFNDVDVFIANDRFRKPLKMAFQVDVRSFSRGAGLRQHQEADPENEYTQVSLPGMTSRPAFTISRVRGEGFLNTIDVNPQSISRGKGKPGIDLGIDCADVISSFDLNCVEAAVDLETGRLSWTRGLAWFMKTAQIQVSNVHGEPHTLVRILKKLEEMPWAHCDLETTGRALMFTLGVKRIIQDSLKPLDDVRKFMVEADARSAASTPAQRREQAKQPIPLILPTLGPIYMKRYARYAPTLERWLSLEEQPLVSRGIVIKVPVAKASPLDPASTVGLEQSVRFLRSLYNRSDEPGRARLSTTARKNLEEKLPFLLHDTTRRCYQHGLVHGKAFEAKTAALARAAQHGHDVFKRRTENAVQREIEAHNQQAASSKTPVPELDLEAIQIRVNYRIGTFNPVTLQSSTLQGADFALGQVDQNAVQAVDAFANEHAEIGGMLLNLPLEQQIKAVVNLKKLDDELGGIAIGLIESNESSFKSLGLLDESALRARLTILKTELSKPIDIKPMPSVELMASAPDALAIRIQEILTPVDLMLEGHRMHHCVGGYVLKMERGDSRIFKITSGRSVRDASTLEMGLDVYKRMPYFEIAQHRGFANGDTPPGHTEAARHLIGQLNTQLYRDCELAPSAPPIVLQSMVVEGRLAQAELISSESSALVDSLRRGDRPPRDHGSQLQQTLNTIFDAGPIVVAREWVTKLTVDGASRGMTFRTKFDTNDHPVLVPRWEFEDCLEDLPKSDLAYVEVFKALYSAALSQASMLTVSKSEQLGLAQARKGVRKPYGMNLAAA